MYEEIEIGCIDETEIETRLSSLNIPFAVDSFVDSKKPPYAVYLSPEAHYFGADGCNMFRNQKFRIELYISSKKSPLKAELLSLFNDVEFEEAEAAIKDSTFNYYLVAIEFNQILPLDNLVFDDDDE